MKYREYRGIEGLVAAKIISDTTEGIEFGEIKQVAGVNELTKETESSSETKYYDNVPAIVIDSTGADTINMNVSAVDLATVAWLTGQMYDEATGMFVEGEREKGYFALGYITKDTDGNLVYVWRLKGTFGVPPSTHITENSGTDANGQELVYTGISTTHRFTKTGKTAKAINVEASKELADVKDFFTTVQTPDTVKGKAVQS